MKDYCGEFEELLLGIIYNNNYTSPTQLKNTMLNIAEKNVTLGALYTTLHRLT